MKHQPKPQSSASKRKNRHSRRWASRDCGVPEPLESRVCLAATPVWLGDLNSQPVSPSSGQYVAAKDFVYFTAQDGQYGNELWRTDGTPQGTRLIKDIHPGADGSNINLIAGRFDQTWEVDENLLYFVADDGVHGSELWRSDGTEQGTRLLKDVSADQRSSYPSGFRLIGSTLFFNANDGLVGQELWKSDGTSEGTMLVRDIAQGPSSSYPSRGNELDGRLIFAARDDNHGQEMWSSDGTDGGTFLLKDINPAGDGVKYASGPCVHCPVGFAPIKHPSLNRIFFTGNDGTRGGEPWVTDGTTAGTFLLRDINPNAAYSNPSQATPVGDSLFFSAMNGSAVRDLWKSNGTRGGTTSVTTGLGPSYPSGFTVAGSHLFFTGFNDAQGTELWQSDLNGQARVVMNINSKSGSYPEPKGVLGETFFFAADDGQTGRELWKTNGQGATLVKDINERGSSDPMWTALAGERLVFAVRDNAGKFQVWSTDESAANVVLLHQGNQNPYLGEGISWGGQVFFTGGDGQVWHSDGTPDGTRILSDDSLTQDSSPQSFVQYQGRTYFLAYDGNNQGLYVHDPASASDQPVIVMDNVTTVEVFRDQLAFLHRGGLWLSDGTAAGTASVGIRGTGWLKSIRAGDDILFLATDDALWKSDGTVSGTFLLKNHLDASNYQNGHPRDLTTIGNTLFFSSFNLRNGRELWKSDGTPEGTAIVRDLQPGVGGSYPTSLSDVGGRLFFAADDGQHGRELWTSDGTADGTTLVADFNTHERSSGSNPTHFIRTGDTLHFVTGSVNDRQSLWQIRDGALTPTLLREGLYNIGQMIDFRGRLLFVASGGSAVGPTLWVVNDERDGLTEVTRRVNSPYELTINGNSVYFSGSNSQGRELWKTDGTEVGTVKLSGDTGRNQSGSYPSNLTLVDGSLYFVAQDAMHGRELWKSDGTSTGTMLVQDIHLGTTGSYPAELRQLGHSLLFSADAPANGRELWSTDGTAGGTRVVTDLRVAVTNGSFGDQYTQLGESTFFVADDGFHGRELWKTDGTESGTVRITDIQPGPSNADIDSLRVLGDRLFFSALGPRGMRTLWMADESLADAVEVPVGTRFLVEPREMVVLNDQLFFAAASTASSSHRYLYRIDVSSGEVLAQNVGSAFPQRASDPTNLVVVGKQLFFVSDDGVHGRELWRTDGTDAGTELVKDIVNLVATASAGQFQHVGDLVFFVAEDAQHGRELWVTDGTEPGTRLVRDIFPGAAGGSPLELTELNGKLIFTADSLSGRELWMSDGTRNGTRIIRNINLRDQADSNPQSLLKVDGIVFFFAENSSGAELWRTDGSRNGTTLVHDIRAGVGSAISLPDQLVAIGTTLYFVADDGAHGRELWKSDGSALGTVLVRDVRLGAMGSIATDPGRNRLVPMGSRLFFAADADGRGGAELWVTDGSDAGTAMLFDRRAGANGPLPLDVVGDWLYFSASGDNQGMELWRTDGTAANTLQVADLSPGPASSSFMPHAKFVPLGPDKILFPAVTSNSGRELWVTDGTAEGTNVLDLEPGTDSTNFGPLVQVRQLGEFAYFFASTRGRGSGLWRSDGTFAGTELVVSAPLEPWPDLTVIDQQLYFGVSEDVGALVRYTEASTTYVPFLTTDPLSSSNPKNLTAVEDLLYFVADDVTHGLELWRSDGTSNGTELVADINPGPRGAFPDSLMAVGSQLYFSASDLQSGTELWTTMGTKESTRRVRDIYPGAEGSLPVALAAWNGQLVFAATSPATGREPWISDGSEAGTVLLSDLAPGDEWSDPSGALAFEHGLFVLRGDDTGQRYLWIFDSPDAAPTQFATQVSSLPKRIGQQFYYSAFDSKFGDEPWVSDGTVAGSHVLADVNASSIGSDPKLLTVVGERVFFVISDGVEPNAELWQMDTSNGAKGAVMTSSAGVATSLLATSTSAYVVYEDDGIELSMIDTGSSRAEPLWQDPTIRVAQPLLVLSDDRLFFTASDPHHGTELWVTNGTPGGTRLVRDINRGSLSTQITDWQEFRGGLLFIASEASRGKELWFSDGTDAGTYPVANVRPGPDGSSVGSLYVSNDLAYFSANDGIHGFEPWISDGTAPGTRMLANVDVGTFGSAPSSPVLVGADVFFVAAANDEQRRLWRWDTKTGSPAVVAPFLSDANSLANVDGTLYFSAYRPEFGHELWLSDGTTEGTRLAVDLNSGSGVTSPLGITGVNGNIYFSAIDDVHGREAWWLPTIAGDTNADRKVDFADFTRFASHFGGTGSRREGDFNGDGRIDFVDFLMLANNFNPAVED